ncbi:MAG: hypothetical protein DRI57_25240 [Deltaproteobacteria bacterium]|nr:MAG: hypothetical protein DRI57_25240 [Deltaproteobacteria bacterium]
MKKVKIGYWSVIITLIVLFFVQNQGIFVETKIFSYNLFSIKVLADLELKWFLDYKTSELYLGYFFTGFFAAGVILTFIYKAVLVEFQLKSRIRFLNKTCETQRGKISVLEREVESLRITGFQESEDMNIVDIPKKDDSSGKKKLKKK